ncbi:MAG: hypothetical protein LLF28_00870 [Nitrospiraceae bacterium]|nr:hypothetical protein [Nitrospiraceae bacterium]
MALKNLKEKNLLACILNKKVSFADRGNVSAPFHQDFVFFTPDVKLINAYGKTEILMKNGKFS